MDVVALYNIICLDEAAADRFTLYLTKINTTQIAYFTLENGSN